MTNKPRKLLLGGFACAAFLALSVPAMAIPVNGSATWTGVLTLTNTGVLSFCPPVTPTQTPCPPVSAGAPGWNVPGSGTADLAPYGSDPNGGTITTLSQATNPVGVTLATPTLFMTFAPAPGVGDISFYMQTVFAGVGDGCGGVPASGQTCTPPGSSLTFLSLAAGGNSSATIAAQGFARHASDAPGFAAASPLQYIFTAQFNKSFQGVLADFNASGSITSAYSATATATDGATSVPEPASWFLLGSGVAVLAALRRKKAA